VVRHQHGDEMPGATAEDYQLGTIRILLARGCGRVRLLVAKLAVLTGFVLVAGLVLAAVDVSAFAGMFVAFGHGIPALPGALWRDVALSGLSVAASLGFCVVLGSAVGAIGRSLAFALPVALCWFPADNVAVLIANAVYAFTRLDAVRQLTAYLVGPNLNAMPGALEAGRHFTQGYIGPMVPVTGVHAVVVTGIYALALLTISIVLTARRDVKD
jgi:hypothetical protein